MHGKQLSALALATLAGAAQAGTPAAENEWLSLDRELAALEANFAPLAEEAGGVEVSGWVKTHYDSSNDVITASGNDLGGFGLDGIRINVTGKVGDYSMKITAEGKSGTFAVRDAFVRLPVIDNVSVQLGQFKSRFLYSYYASNDKLVFYRRSAIASAWGTRDTGAQIDGRFGPFLGVIQLQNGDDAAGDEWALTAKAFWAVMGKMIEKQLGGFGTDAETALTLGVGYFDDSTVSNSSAISAEAVFTSGPIFAAAEAVSHDDGFTGITSGVASKVDAAGFADDTPWDVTLAWMLTEQWELAAEYEDNDDPGSTTTVRGGVNYYVHGHAAKWQLNYATTSSDSPALEVDLVTLGLLVSI